MKTILYFQKVAEIHRKFSIIQADFKDVIQKGILGINEKKSLDWNKTRKTTDRFDKYITELKTMRDELISIRKEVGNRGGGFFKHGNIKQKLDQSVTVEIIQSLKTEMKNFVNATKKADTRQDADPIKNYLKEYENKHLSQENKAAVQNSRNVT